MEIRDTRECRHFDGVGLETCGFVLVSAVTGDVWDLRGPVTVGVLGPDIS